MQYRKLIEQGKPTDFLVITVITLLFLIVIAMNVRLIFQMTSNQIEEIGQMQIENIRSDIESKILNSENATVKVANEAEKLIAAGATQDELTRFFYQKKREENVIFNGVCFNTYIANKSFSIIPDFDMPENYHSPERLWYIGAAENPDKVFITEPYIDAAGNGICFTMSKMLPDKENVVAMDFYLEDLQKLVTKMTENSTRTALIVSQNGLIVGYNDINLVSKKLSDKLPQYQDILERVIENQTHESFLVKINGDEYTIFSSQTRNGWYLIVGVDNWTLYKESYRQTIYTLVISVIMLLVIIVFYLRGMKHRLESEKALRAKEEFLSGLSKELRTPLKKILELSRVEKVESTEKSIETAAQVQESAFQLSDMLDNLFSFSNIVSNDSNNIDTSKTSNAKGVYDASKNARIGIILVLVFAIVISMFFCINTNINWGDTKMNREVDEYEFQLSTWMERQTSVVNSFTNVIAANPELFTNYNNAVRILNDYAEKYPDISVCYIANPYNEHPVIMNNGWESPDPNWRVEQRQWYIDTLKSNENCTVSAPYYDDQTGLYCLTISKKIYGKNNEFLGIFAADFFLDKLIHILDASYTQKSYAFLVDKNGVIISHPNKDYQMNTNNSINIEDTEYIKTYSNEGAVFILDDYRNAKIACLAKKNDISNFTVIVAENWWDIYGNAVTLGVVFAVILIICIAAVIMLIERILKWQNEVNKKLKASAKEAILAGKARSQFFAQMSHEIRTPMNAVLGMNELILRESTNPAILEYAETIQSAGRTLLGLINSILDFSKIENGQMKIVPVRYETATLINDLVTMASERASKKGLDLMVEIDKKLPRLLFGDDLRIKQIITNLLTNAIKYTPKGTVNFSVKIISSDDENIEIMVKIKDTGIGIKQEDIDKLSISFIRLDEEKNRNIEGTGLGISIVQKLLTMMGSKLEVESEYGKGSMFSFMLNQKIVDKTPIENYRRYNSGEKIVTVMQNKTYFNAAGAKILVVDDNSMNLKVIRGILKYNEVVPTLAESGFECLELVAKNHYDLIFLDHMMPEMDGIETLERIKAEHLADDTIIIALTANAISGAREFYLQKGFNDYLSKPINPGELDSILKKYLEKILEAQKIQPVAEIQKVSENPVEEVKTAENVAEVEENADTFTESEKKLLAEICPEINLEIAMEHCMDSKEFFIEMVQEFFNGNKTAEVNKCYSAEDWKNYRILVHALKSTALVIGAEKFSEQAKTQEFAAKDNRLDDLKKNHNEFIISYEKFLNQIGNWLKGTSSNAKNTDS